MAGHEIWVPTSWTVLSDVVPIIGGVDDKRLPPLEALAENAAAAAAQGHHDDGRRRHQELMHPILGDGDGCSIYLLVWQLSACC